MKLLLLALVAFAAAEPEADSYFPYLYSRGLYSNLYNPYRYTYGNLYNYGYYKREAESESDSDSLFYNYPFSTFRGVYNPYRYTYGGLYNYPYVNRYLHKREAESDPAQIYQSTYSTVRYPGYPFGYQRVVGSEPVYKSGNFHTNLRNLNPITSAGYGFPTVGVYGGRVFKREADSDSESYFPYLYGRGLYNAYNPYRYTYGGLYSHPYRYYKREAESDSDSDSFFYNYPYTSYAGVYNPYRTSYAGVYNNPYRTTYSGLYNYPYSF